MQYSQNQQFYFSGSEIRPETSLHSQVKKVTSFPHTRKTINVGSGSP